MLQDVSGRGTWSKKCFKMSLAEPLGARNARMLQDVSGTGTWSKKCFKMSLAEALGARNALRCCLEQEMFQDVSGKGTWSKKCFKMYQDMLQDLSGTGTWGKKCFKMSLAEAFGARNASRCLWHRHLEREMLQDVSG